MHGQFAFTAQEKLRFLLGVLQPFQPFSFQLNLYDKIPEKQNFLFFHNLSTNISSESSSHDSVESFRLVILLAF